MPSSRFTWLNLIGLALALCFALFPVFWIVATSLKTSSEWVVTPPAWIPSSVTLANYRTLFTSSIDRSLSIRDSILPSMLNSLIVSLSATALSIAIGTLTALAISRYRIGGTALLMAILSVRLIPPVLLAVPLLIYFGYLGLHDTLLGLILVYTALTVPFAVLMLKSFIDTVSVHIEEAAMMDGLSRWAAHTFITLPLIKGGFAATAIFIFILNWSEFLFAMVLSDKHAFTLPVELRMFEGDYGSQAALGVLAILPLLVAGMAIQRYLVRGLTFGMIKQ